MTIQIWTIGHSNRSLEALVGMLASFQVQLLADIRTVPRSRHNPQFNRETLPAELNRFGAEYIHYAGLGGLRRPVNPSPNSGWRNESFRGFADYMLTPEFSANLDELIEVAAQRRIAVMCAEAVPWRCHRSLIADALVIRDVSVFHIMGVYRDQPHRLTPWARREGMRLIYPESDSELGFTE
ncbi:MAG: DUF488 domain-containing protein [Armatimonadetes bacterium]|nr:DUF488 domain-containing protein [Armatimonadota bacterium]